MLGDGEPSTKKARFEKQRVYNEKRKEKPRKPQFSLNFQFDFGEEKELEAIQKRFVRLRSLANLRSSRVNADFLTLLLDRYEGNDECFTEKKPEMHDISVQANATDSSFELYAHREEKKEDFQSQWPCGEAPSCTQVLSPARVDEPFFVCGQESLTCLLLKISHGCACGSQFFFDGDNSVKNMDGHVLRLECYCKNGHKIKWASSSILGNKYTANCR